MLLPPALQPWGEPLAALDTELAIALGPLVRQLDQLITRQDAGSGAHGPLDGYDGITRHGSPTRLLVSEWALADAVPAEFLRRAANAELLYLDPAYQQDRERAGVAVLVDTGPDQLGAGRLVQLAALIVLLRRSAARSKELSVGILGDEPGTWHSSEPEVLLRTWLTERRPDDPDPLEIDRWSTADELWILAGPRLARELPGRRRLLTARECAWDDGGSTAAEVRLAGDRIELALPRHDVAIRALRGAGFRPTKNVKRRDADSSGGVRFGMFTGSPPRLIARGNESNELVALTVRPQGADATKPRRYHLPGPVLAAAVYSKRMVALVLVDDTLRAEVIGHSLGHLDRLAVPLSGLGLTAAAVDALSQQDLPSLYFWHGALICQLADRWWRLHPSEPLERLDLSAVAPATKLDEPRTARRSASSTFVTSPPRTLSSTQRVIFGQKHLLARFDGEDWLIPTTEEPSNPGRDTVVDLPADAEPFGLLVMEGLPTLLCYTESDGTIQLCDRNGSRTLPDCPRVVRTPSLHPVQPLLAVELDDRVDVIDLTDNELVATLRGDA